MTRLALVLSAFVLAGAVIFGAAPEAPPGATETYDRLPAGPGRDVLIKACIICHDPQRATAVRLTREGWEGVVTDMAKRGMVATDSEKAVIVEYLAANFLGEAPRPININTAEQIDFETVLTLLRREAAAVIAYRAKNGPFKTVAELKNVPGLDYKKVEKGLDRIVAFIPGTR
jgi:competence protein ComEA